MNSTAKVLPPVETDDRVVTAIVDAALYCEGFTVITAIDGTRLVVARPDSFGIDLDPPTPTPPAPRR